MYLVVCSTRFLESSAPSGKVAEVQSMARQLKEIDPNGLNYCIDQVVQAGLGMCFPK